MREEEEKMMWKVMRKVMIMSEHEVGKRLRKKQMDIQINQLNWMKKFDIEFFVRSHQVMWQLGDRLQLAEDQIDSLPEKIDQRLRVRPKPANQSTTLTTPSHGDEARLLLVSPLLCAFLSDL
jgi:hypothetical protein